MSNTIRQTVTLKARPRDVYEALMDSRKHARFSGEKARISRKVGGRISAYGGYITGTNLELVPGRRIVQSWHASDWPKGYESTVTFVLKRVKGGTRLSFRHAGVPAKQLADLKQGWIDFYWKPMKEMFAG